MAKKDEVKFTEKELQTLNDLQVKYNTITNQFGQLAIAKLNLEKQTEVVNDQEFKLQEELNQAREDEQEILNLISETENIKFQINYSLYELLENKSYLETAYNQVQEKADNLEPDVAAKFLSYPIPKAIVEEWEKVKP